MKLYFSFGLLLVLAWLADLMGLATIVGAFAAGLILEDRFFQMEEKSPEGGQTVESLLASLEQLFAPLFFVLLGFQVDVTTFANFKVLVLGLLLTLVAIFGKMSATLILYRFAINWWHRRLACAFAGATLRLQKIAHLPQLGSV